MRRNRSSNFGRLRRGSYLRRLRQQRGWTQRQLARRSRCHFNTIANLEQGRTLQPKHLTAKRIAKALELSNEQRRRLFPTAGAA